MAGKRIQVQLKDGRQGTIEDWEFNPSTMSMVNAPTVDTSTAAPVEDKSFLQGNAKSSNLFSGDGFLTNLINSFAKPVLNTEQNIQGLGFETVGRPLQALLKGGLDKAYQVDEQGKPLIDNPYLSDEKLSKIKDDGAGYIGDQVKDSIALASYGINPAGKGILDAAWKGAKIGAAQSLPEAQSGEDVAKGAVIGGIANPILGRILSRPAAYKEGEAALKQGIAKPQYGVADDGRTAANMTKLMADAKGVGAEFGVDLSSGNAKKIQGNISSVMGKLDDKVSEELLKDSVPPVQNLLTKLKKGVASEGLHYVPKDKSYTALVDQELKVLDKIRIQEGKGVWNGAALQKAKQHLASAAPKVFDKVKGVNPGNVTKREGVIYDLWRQTDNIISEINAPLKALSQKQSVLHTYAEGVNKSAGSVEGYRPFGQSTGVNLNRILQNIQSKIANGYGGAAPILDRVNTPIKTVPGRDAAIGIPVLGNQVANQQQQQETELNANEQAMRDQVAQYTTANTEQEAAQDPQMLYKQAIQQAIKQDMMETGGANVKDLVAIQTSLDKLDSSESSTIQKRKMAMGSADQIFKEVENLSNNSNSGLTGFAESMVGELPGVEGGQAGHLKRTTEAYAKALANAFAGEVGVATDEDVRRWLGLMPKPGDTPAERKQVLEQLKRTIEANKKVVGLQSNTTPEIPATLQAI